MLTKLTKKQQAALKTHAEKWIKIGLSTEPVDKATAVKGMQLFYEAANLKWHNKVIWVSSPIVGALAFPIALHVLNNSAVKSAVHSAVQSVIQSAVQSAVRSTVCLAVDLAVNSAVNSAVHPAVKSAVHLAVNSTVNSAVRSTVQSVVNSAVDSAVHSAVDSAVHSAVDSAINSAINPAVDSAVDSAVNSAVDLAVDSAVYLAVYSAVNSAVNSAVKSNWCKHLSGAMWASYPAWGTFYRDYCGIDVPIDSYELTAKSCGWWWPSEKFVIACDRPKYIKLDAEGRLHSANSPAIQWRDGWGIYCWHGKINPFDIYKMMSKKG